MRAGNVIKHDLEKQVMCLHKFMGFSPCSHLLRGLMAVVLETAWKIQLLICFQSNEISM